MYLPGCPPRPEMLLDAILKLHDKIMDEPLGVNAKRRQLPDYAPRELVPSSQRYTAEGRKVARQALRKELMQ
jgi:NADH-quinone oxidoreductase subunit B